jgi:hypothetical protein
MKFKARSWRAGGVGGAGISDIYWQGQREVNWGGSLWETNKTGDECLHIILPGIPAPSCVKFKAKPAEFYDDFLRLTLPKVLKAIFVSKEDASILFVCFSVSVTIKWHDEPYLLGYNAM